MSSDRRNYYDYLTVRDAWVQDMDKHHVALSCYKILVQFIWDKNVRDEPGSHKYESFVRYVLERGMVGLNEVGSTVEQLISADYIEMASLVTKLYPEQVKTFATEQPSYEWCDMVASVVCSSDDDADALTNVLLDMRSLTKRDALQVIRLVMYDWHVDSSAYVIPRAIAVRDRYSISWRDFFRVHSPDWVLISVVARLVFPDAPCHLLDYKNPYKMTTEKILETLRVDTPPHVFTEHALRVLQGRPDAPHVIRVDRVGDDRNRMFKTVAKHGFLIKTPCPVSKRSKRRFARIRRRVLGYFADVVCADCAGLVIEYI